MNSCSFWPTQISWLALPGRIMSRTSSSSTAQPARTPRTCCPKIKAPWPLPKLNPPMGEDPMSSQVRKACDVPLPLTEKEPIGAGTGGGEVAALICCQREREQGGTHFSPDKLFAYQLPLVKEKIFLVPSVPRVGLVWGPGLPAAQAARPSFRICDSCPPGLFWEAAQLRSTPAFLRGISRHSKAVCTPGPRLPASSQACLSSRSATVIIPLPTSPATPAGVRLPGVGGRDSQLNGGKGSLSASLVSSVRPMASTASKHQAGPPGVHPVPPGAPPPSLTPQGSSLCEN